MYSIASWIHVAYYTELENVTRYSLKIRIRAKFVCQLINNNLGILCQYQRLRHLWQKSLKNNITVGPTNIYTFALSPRT